MVIISVDREDRSNTIKPVTSGTATDLVEHTTHQLLSEHVLQIYRKHSQIDHMLGHKTRLGGLKSCRVFPDDKGTNQQWMRKDPVTSKCEVIKYGSWKSPPGQHEITCKLRVSMAI